MLEPLLGHSGWLAAWKLRASSFDTEEALILAGTDGDGNALSDEHCRRLLMVPARLDGTAANMPATLSELCEQAVNAELQKIEERNGRYLDEEQIKLDAWAEDRKLALETEIREADRAIREAKRNAGGAKSLAEKLAAQKEIKALEATRNRRRRDLFDMQDKIDAQREELIERIQSQMKQTHSVEPLFACEWTLEG
jgi:adenine-specific DNA-methyltransferase